MNPIFYLLIPFAIGTFFISLHFILEAYRWRKELRNDEKKRKLVDILLYSDDVQEWYEKEYPKIS